MIDIDDDTFDEMSYEDILSAEYKNQLKKFIDWFVVKYLRFIQSRCIKAARKIGMPELWEDLTSESIIEAYAIGNRYNPANGDLLKFLIASLWFYPMREDKVKKVKSNSHDEHEKVINNLIRDYSCGSEIANVDDGPVYSFEQITGSLEEQDQLLFAFKYKLGLPNTTIGQLCGLNESTIRSRIASATSKLQGTLKTKHNELVNHG